MIPIPPALFRSLQGIDSELLERIKVAYRQEKDQYLTAVAAELEAARKPPSLTVRDLEAQVRAFQARVIGLEDQLRAVRKERTDMEQTLVWKLENATQELEELCMQRNWYRDHPVRHLLGWLLRRKP